MTDLELQRLARLEERINSLVKAVDRLTTHVDKLRLWQAYLLGAGAVIGAGLTLLFSKI